MNEIVKTNNGRTRNQLTKLEVRELFDYKDGKLFWKCPPSNRVDISKPAGSMVLDSGYCNIKIKGKYYRRHVLIWNYFNDLITEDGITVDHEKSISQGGDDRIENLRLLTMSKNNQNKVARNKLGITSVRFIDRNLNRPWQVNMPNYKISEYFPTLEEAVSFRDETRARLGLSPAQDKDQGR